MPLPPVEPARPLPRRRRAPTAAGLALGTLAAMLLVAAPAAAVDPRTVRVSFVSMSSGLSSPVAIAGASDGSNRIYIVEQAGRIRVRIPQGLVSQPYLDIRDRVGSGGERGLLGLAFHPQYARNGRFFVAYTDKEGDVRVSRFTTTPGSLTAPASSEYVLLEVPHRSYSNHNGGAVAFGKDGYLYAGFGDGGGGGDPQNNAQKMNTLLGKVIRIDVNKTCSPLRYCIPSNNPFVRASGARKEIFFLGLRNPWRVTFDLRDGPIWIADVGQSSKEELNTFSSGVGGRNLGWDCREGSLNTVSSYGGSYCNGKSFSPPLYEYSTGGGRCAIIGGYVYRGSTYASIFGGVYVYGDYCSGQVWGLARQPDKRLVNAQLADHSANITTFGQTPNGEIYAADSNGTLYHLRPSRR